MNPQLYQHLTIANTIAKDFPDGAWQAYLEDSVREFNQAHRTKYDPFETWLYFCHKLSEPGENKRPFNVGNLVAAEKDFSNVKAGMIGVVYEVYNRSGFDDNGGEGVSIIFESGFYDGFSLEDLELCHVKSTELRVYVLSDYRFTNVDELTKDFERGLFKPAFKLGQRLKDSNEQ